MKAIMLSINPKWVAKILNCEKTIEIRKKFPKDYVGWVYIYCTKNKPNLYRHFKGEFLHLKETNEICLWNGKVVARFWCDKVEHYVKSIYNGKRCDYKELLKKSCIDGYDLVEYCNLTFYALYISQLEIFDKPKELSEFGLKRAPQSRQYIEVDE